VPEGSDTLGSLRAAAQAAADRGWHTAVIVSDPWHSLRARTMADNVGLDAWTSPTHSGPIVQTRQTQIRYILYETAALLYYRTTKASADGIGITEDVAAGKEPPHHAPGLHPARRRADVLRAGEGLRPARFVAHPPQPLRPRSREGAALRGTAPARGKDPGRRPG